MFRAVRAYISDQAVIPRRPDGRSFTINDYWLVHTHSGRCPNIPGGLVGGGRDANNLWLLGHGTILHTSIVIGKVPSEPVH